jgi:hypothetical protein
MYCYYVAIKTTDAFFIHKKKIGSKKKKKKKNNNNLLANIQALRARLGMQLPSLKKTLQSEVWLVL